MKSGYGIGINVTNRVTGNGEKTSIQNGVAMFPEFDYNKYYRILDGTDTMQFKVNPASLSKSRVHYTPIWYPNKTNYEVKVRVIDLWTPIGMLSTSTSDFKIIDGSLWDDRHVSKQ